VSALIDALRDELAAEWPDAPAGAVDRVLAGLCRRCGGSEHYLPIRPPGAAVARLAGVLAAGGSIDDAAAAAGISARHARRLRVARSRGRFPR